MTKLAQWQEGELDKVIKHLNDLSELARGKISDGNTCAVDFKGKVTNLAVWIDTWVLPRLKNVRNSNKDAMRW